MPARVNRRADPFAATCCRESRKILTGCSAYLLKLIQYICPTLFQERSSLLPHFDGVGEFNRARGVRHVTNYFQRRAFSASPPEIEAKSLGQLQLRYAQVVL